MEPDSPRFSTAPPRSPETPTGDPNSEPPDKTRRSYSTGQSGRTSRGRTFGGNARRGLILSRFQWDGRPTPQEELRRSAPVLPPCFPLPPPGDPRPDSARSAGNSTAGRSHSARLSGERESLRWVII